MKNKIIKLYKDAIKSNDFVKEFNYSEFSIGTDTYPIESVTNRAYMKRYYSNFRCRDLIIDNRTLLSTEVAELVTVLNLCSIKKERFSISEIDVYFNFNSLYNIKIFNTINSKIILENTYKHRFKSIFRKDIIIERLYEKVAKYFICYGSHTESLSEKEFNELCDLYINSTLEKNKEKNINIEKILNETIKHYEK